MEHKIKHLEFIQGIINRLSSNSFLLKGWSVVLVSALFALSAKDADSAFVFLAYIPTLIFWGLDGYYLWQERIYRKLYDCVRQKNDDDIDFSMDTRDVSDGLNGWFSATISKTIVLFHGVLVVAILIVLYLQ